MTGMFDLRNIFELIDDRLNDTSVTEPNLIP